jgi:hypothetical protein
MITNKDGDLIESNDYRLPKLIVDKGLKLLEKNPNLRKQLEICNIAGRTDMAFMKFNKKAGKGRRKGKAGKKVSISLG